VQIGLYVHFPFCISKCRYCDFNSYPAPAELRERYLSALTCELQRRLPQLSEASVSTVFFGGGTPTIYTTDELARVLRVIGSAGNVEPGAEVTCEANPDTVSLQKLKALRGAGFNRLSLGVQSLADDELQVLGRSHNAHVASAAIAAARETFDNLSVDLIYGIPGQGVQSWGRTLYGIIRSKPDHVSAYGLMIEEGTPLHEMVAAGQVQPLDDDTYADLYELAQRTLGFAGYEQYEISNFARPGRRCTHNLTYWRNQPYLGCGAGAASYLGGVRSMNVVDPESYCRAVEANGEVTASQEHLDPAHRAGETVMLCLRTIKGADLRQIMRECGTDLREQHADTIATLVAEGIATYDDGILRLTPAKGFLLHSEIARRFLV